MADDSQGLSLTGSGEAVAAYDRAIEHLIRFQPAVVDAAAEAAADPGCVLGRVFGAYLGLMSPFVGPEYPAWSQYYDLGGFQPYQYNVTLAQKDIAAANIKNMPTFLMKIWSGCEACSNAAQVIQSDLAAIGINVNLEVLTTNQVLAPMGNYATNVQNAQEIGQLNFVNAGAGWGPAALTPADYWQTFVSNQSTYGKLRSLLQSDRPGMRQQLLLDQRHIHAARCVHGCTAADLQRRPVCLAGRHEVCRARRRRLRSRLEDRDDLELPVGPELWRPGRHTHPEHDRAWLRLLDPQ